ncbi:MAG: methylmalonyl-CoA mutase [bacterium]|nr:methylmalonyl-CoA mutase [bacterium]
MTSATRPIKVLVAKPGLDGHDVGAKILCRFLMDAGMEVIYTGLRRSATQIARAAVDEGVDAVALSILSGAHRTLSEKVVAELEKSGGGACVIVGGNIPARDVEGLKEVGVARAFATGSQPDEVIEYLNRTVQR